jgi:hypothetical protein
VVLQRSREAFSSLTFHLGLIRKHCCLLGTPLLPPPKSRFFHILSGLSFYLPPHRCRFVAGRGEGRGGFFPGTILPRGYPHPGMQAIVPTFSHQLTGFPLWGREGPRVCRFSSFDRGVPPPRRPPPTPAAAMRVFCLCFCFFVIPLWFSRGPLVLLLGLFSRA